MNVIPAIETTGLKSINFVNQPSRHQIIREENCNDDNNWWITSSDDKTLSITSNRSQLSKQESMKTIKISQTEISNFKALTDSILTVVKQFGSISSRRSGPVFWEKVAQHMKSKGFEVSWNDCRIIQDHYVNNLYGLVFNLNCFHS